MKKGSFQPHPLARFRVQSGQILFSCAGHLVTMRAQRRDHGWAVRNLPPGDLIRYPVMQLFPRLRACSCLDNWLCFGSAFRILRIRPIVVLVEVIPQRIKIPLIPWRRDVKALPRQQLQSWCAEMKLNAPFMLMSNPKAIMLPSF
jgi:hypothetical protein